MPHFRLDLQLFKDDALILLLLFHRIGRLRKLSERFNISESYLSYLFKERTGVNFSAFLEKLRMDEAALRLRSGQAVLTTLYSDLGYTNAIQLDNGDILVTYYIAGKDLVRSIDVTRIRED